jgi:hypothetical protein
MSIIQITRVCKSKEHKGKMLAIVLDDQGMPMVRTNKLATAEELLTALSPVLDGGNSPKRFAEKLQQVKP